MIWKGHFNKLKPQDQHFLSTHSSFSSYSRSSNDHLISWQKKKKKCFLHNTSVLAFCTMHYFHTSIRTKTAWANVLFIFACLRLHCSIQGLLIPREFPFNSSCSLDLCYSLSPDVCPSMKCQWIHSGFIQLIKYAPAWVWSTYLTPP